VVEVADGIDLHVLSIVDPENWKKDLPEDRVNIALYHGSVVGSVTDSGWMMTHGDISLDELERYDYALLGDIHKTDQKVDNDGRANTPARLYSRTMESQMIRVTLYGIFKIRIRGLHDMFR
jgi:hypothetical protein